MEHIVKYITESVQIQSILGKIKRSLNKQFGDKIQIVSFKAGRCQYYDIYCYQNDMESYQFLNDLFKKYLAPKFKGYDESKLKEKLEEAKKIDKQRETSPYDLPYVFMRFDSWDLKNLDNPNYSKKHKWLKKTDN